MGKKADLRISGKEKILAVFQHLGREKVKIKAAIKTGNLPRADAPLKYGDLHRKTSQVLDVSLSTVIRVIREHKSHGSFRNAPKNQTGRRRVEIDSFTEGVIRRCIMDFYSKKTFPTLGKIHKLLQDDQNFPRMSLTTMWRVMKKQLKFKFIKFEGKPVPLERPDIVAQRADYLVKIKELRAQGYKIFYQDESWVNANQSPSKGWHIPETAILGMGNRRSQVDIWLKGVGHRFSDGLIGGIASKPSGAGQRIIMIAVGSEDGFLEGTSKLFIGKKNSKSPDYHSEMNSDHFTEWISDVIEKLPEKSVLVLDQATYHRKITEETKNPTTGWRKPELIEWLNRKNIDFEEKMKRPDLLKLAKANRIAPRFEVDEILKRSGKDVQIMWLPVAHCELNAIELIWSRIKQNVSKMNTTFKIKDVLELAIREINSNEIKEIWPKCVNHVIDLEDLIIQKENIVKNVLKEFPSMIIRVSDESDSENESDIENEVAPNDSDIENEVDLE